MPSRSEPAAPKEGRESTGARPVNEAAAIVPGARGLLYWQIGALAWYIARWLIWTFALAANRPTWFHSWLRFSNVPHIPLLAGGTAMLVWFTRGRRGTTARGVSQAALALIAVLLVSEIVGTAGGLASFDSSLGRGFDAAFLLAYGAFEVCLWLALVRSRSALRRFSAAYYVLIAAHAALSFQRMLPKEMIFRARGVASFLHWSSFGIGLAESLVLIVALRELARAGEARTGDAPSSAPARDLLIGSLWLGGGLLVTLVSYGAASSSTGGGHYVITTGAIAYGLVRLIRGLGRAAAPGETPDSSPRVDGQ